MADDAPQWKDAEIAAVRALLAQMRPPEGRPDQTWAERRAGMDTVGELGSLPPGCVKTDVDLGGMPAELLTPEGSDATRAILYLHGGGYCVGSPRSHRPMVGWLAEEAGVPALVPDYRMGPEDPFPAAIDDGVKAYRHLLDRGIAPGRIVIAGDSAGGGLTVATALGIRAAGLPQPAGLFCISPWADLRQTGLAYERLIAIDPMLTRESLNDYAAAYLAGAPASDPLASPVLADLTGLAPMLIHVGGAEILMSDATALAERAGLDGVKVRLEIWPEMIHVWHAFSAMLTAGRKALAEAGQWIDQQTR
jgi:monoterpene epsilon-lactone hydrolase